MGYLMNDFNIQDYRKHNLFFPIWYPFSYTYENILHRLYIEYGEGIYLYDDLNKRYIDAVSGLWNVSLGYKNRIIDEAVIKQINRLSYCSSFRYANSTSMECADALLEFTDHDFEKVIFACSGSETIEAAIKLMRQYWVIQNNSKKKIIVSFSDSYHGTYMGSISVSGMERNSIIDISPTLPQIDFIDSVSPITQGNQLSQACDNNGCDECLKQIKDYFENNHEEIAGFIVEPILASKGVIIPCKEFLKKLILLCHSYEILVAFDEVVTGFYRTGTSFYYKKLDFVPDLLCLSKGINSGYLPAGAVLVGRKIENAYHKNYTILEHGSTQAGNLIVCASITAAVNEYQKLNDAENLIEKSMKFYHILYEKIHKLNCILELRSEGFMFSIDFFIKVQNTNQKKLIFIQKALEKEGLLVNISETGIVLMPMLITKVEEWEMITDILSNIISKIH